jgi:uncharacterized coiled-coil DUF342 family protein
MTEKLKSTTKSLLTIGITAGLIYAFLNHQAIIDEWRLRSYDPPKEIVRLADRTTMNDDTRRLFYVNQPSIDNKDTFRHACQGTEKTIVLGCYVPNRGIFLLRVTDKRLNGIHEVTAAHEVLHAAYDRLSAGDRREVDRLTESMLKNITDERILETVEQYKNGDAHSVPNELHSILGTEVRQLSPELEEHYSQYFNNRSKIVDYLDRYQEAFTSREERAEALLNQMNGIETQISQADRQLQIMRADLNAQNQSLEAKRDSSDAEEFNQEVKEYNASVQEFNSQLNYRNDLARQYNTLRDEYNALVVEEKELIKAIDSRAPAL